MKEEGRSRKEKSEGWRHSAKKVGSRDPGSRGTFFPIKNGGNIFENIGIFF